MSDEQNDEKKATGEDQQRRSGVTYRDADGVEIPAEAVAQGALNPSASPRSFVVPDQEDYDQSAYLGVSPEYATHSHHTHAPSLTEEERFLFTPPTDDEMREMEDERARRQEELYGVPVEGDEGSEGGKTASEEPVVENKRPGL